MEQRPIIALVGRPNVGKSTLFNRLIGRREAITSHLPGTTRDRHFGIMRWFRHAWTLIDTAGVVLGEEEDEAAGRTLQAAMDEQVAVAVEEATVVAVIVDVKEGIHPDDKRLLTSLRKHNKPLVVLVNKADNKELHLQAESFRSLGISTIFSISAIHGQGIGEFVDYLMEHFPALDPQVTEATLPRVTFIGRPNVGKSTLVNRVIGENRMIVSDIPGTTRDSIESEASFPDGTRFRLIDTAGIRRRGRIEQGIETFSLFRTLKAINASDIVVLLLTIEEPPTRGDAHVAMYALEANKRILIALNKTDLARDPILKMDRKKQAVVGGKFFKRFAFLQRMPSVFVSAQTGQGIDTLLSELKAMIEQTRRASTPEAKA